MINPENKELLDALIVGRVKPHIYAFTTNTIPNYLKVGDTYRPVIVRLREWMQHFPNLHKEYENVASINDDIFFRDYSVHQYLENDLGRPRLTHTEFPDVYFSNEFFKDVLIEHIDAAITDIQDNYAKNTGKYKYYDANSQLPETFTYASTGEWKMRPNQEDTVKRFVAAVDSGHTNLLMYAVMRFGKSFTSLCCVKAKGYKVVLVVSAKADVREEWKKTVQSADNFNKDYVFISSEELLRDEDIITNTLNGGKGAVIFLTLQDLQGDEIKEKHKDVFDNKIDLLIVDETHYGARAESYGKILRATSYEKDVKDKHADDDFIEIEDAEEQLKSLSVKVTLHLSGTPYRILMGSEFSKEDIIAFYQFSDIVKDQEAWDKEHLLNDEEEVKEWDNPYYGFPQMIRFAFVPSKSALALLESLKSSGTTYAFSALLKPQSLKKDTEHSLHKRFVYENEVLELFEAVDGSKDDDGLLSFLDYDKIKEGKMCQHIVCVLPYCTSCDALEALIHNNADKFKNLQNYTIINISGVDSPNEYRSVQAVKAKIKQCAAEDKKTLTLTVNRMLTGSTVEEWDTMIFLKDTASPQEYDQAIFRLQNQYVREYREPDGDVIKFNMKPQTLLVDFDPHRMFVMQEQKSQIYNANTDVSGNEHLRDRLEDELRISPIITLNKNRIEQVQATDILAEISEYSSSRGVLDETKDIPVDMSLLDVDVIRATIESQAELGSRQGLSVDAHKGAEGDLENPDNDDDDFSQEDNSNGSDTSGNDSGSTGDSQDTEDDIRSLENKFRTYYSRILFFAFLTKSSAASLEDILTCIDNDENPRIAKNLNLDKAVLTQIKENMNIFILRQLDYKIQNMNTLAHDESVDPMQRASVAIRKFGRISDSEITTPETVAGDMTDLIPDECFIGLRETTDARILDIASKMGEFAMAVVKRCNSLGIPISDIKGKVLSIATSSATYEFTRKVYEVLGLDIECIAEQFNSYELLTIKVMSSDGTESDKIDYPKICNILSQNKPLAQIALSDGCESLKEEEKMRFEAVVGNPPYQENTAKHESKSNGQNTRKSIFQYFQIMADQIAIDYTVLIYPGARWIHRSGKGMDHFGLAQINDKTLKTVKYYPDSRDIFKKDAEIQDGISIVVKDKAKVDNGFNYIYCLDGNEITILMDNPGDDLIPLNPKDIKIVKKIDEFVRGNGLKYLHDAILPRSLFGIDSDFVEKNSGNAILYDGHSTYDTIKYIKLFTNDKAGSGGRATWFLVERNLIIKNIDKISEWQVVVSSAHPGGQDNRSNQLEIIDNNSAFGRSRVALRSFDNFDEANNFYKYMQSKLVMYCFLMTDEALTSLGKRVPDLLNYSNNDILNFDNDIDSQLYSLLGLTDAEIGYIESRVTNARPKGTLEE